MKIPATCVLLCGLFLALAANPISNAADCNGNGVDDAEDLAQDPPNFRFPAVVGASFLPHSGVFVIAADLNGDDNPDLATTGPSNVSVVLNRGDGTFGDAVSYVTGEDPWSMISADFNGDGKLDLATVDRVLGIFVLVNRGDGSFEGAVLYRVGGSPTSPSSFLVADDFNGDGNPDLAVVSTYSTVSVLLNQGDGTFVGATDYLVGGQLQALVTVDLNGDGKPDLATADYGFGSVNVLLNTGDGTFGAPVNYGAEAGDSLIAADFDGDSNVDLAVKSSNGDSPGIVLLLNKGDGTFVDAVKYNLVTYPWAFTAADLNDDGKLDLATADYFAKTVSILFNGGNGAFRSVVSYPVDETPTFLLADDFNSDGKLDLATEHSQQGGFSVLFNNGNGDFQSRMTYAGTPMGSYHSLIKADFSGDGKPDLFAGGCIYVNQGDGKFTGAVTYPLGGFYSSRFGGVRSPLIVADLNSDGNPDLFSGSAVLLNQGDGTFGRTVSYSAGSTVQSQIAADLDGDGKLDLVTASGCHFCAPPIPGTVSVLLNVRDGTFTISASYPAGDDPQSLVVADLNGDGSLDLATTNFEGTRVDVLLNKGGGTFWDAVSYLVGGQPQSLIAADLNGDGLPELATANYGIVGGPIHGSVSLLLNQGSGTFGAAVNLSYAPDTNPIALVAADLNGDGRPDLATGDERNLGGELVVHLNEGGAAFRHAVSYPVDTSPASVVAADLNGDGMPDLSTSGVWVFLNQGGGTFNRPAKYSLPGYPGYLVAADLNGDDTQDLAYAYGGWLGGHISILLNLTTLPFSVDLNHNGIPDECETHFHRGDPNSSGTTDISDGIAIFGYLFLGNPSTLSCLESADANNDAKIDISDGIAILQYLFGDGPPPAAPGPPDAPCGLDVDPPGSAGDLGCEGYKACG